MRSAGEEASLALNLLAGASSAYASRQFPGGPNWRKNWASFAGLLVDLRFDRDALRHARFQKITTRETIDIRSITVADGDIRAAEAFGLMNQIADSDR